MEKGQLEVINLHKLIEHQTDYINFIVSTLNDHSLRIVINGEFHWHTHEDYDELFYVLEENYLNFERRLMHEKKT